MGVLLDTNILSELRKGQQADPKVIAWVQSIERERQAISVLSLGEIRKGILTLQRKDEAQANILNKWLNNLSHHYASDILPVCEKVSLEWGRLNARRSLPVIDGLIAATAKIHGLTIATRNVQDFKDLDLTVMNPFCYQ